MKKLLLVPTLLTVASTPLISLVGCGCSQHYVKLTSSSDLEVNPSTQSTKPEGFLTFDILEGWQEGYELVATFNNVKQIGGYLKEYQLVQLANNRLITVVNNVATIPVTFIDGPLYGGDPEDPEGNTKVEFELNLSCYDGSAHDAKHLKWQVKHNQIINKKFTISYNYSPWTADGISGDGDVITIKINQEWVNTTHRVYYVSDQIFEVPDQKNIILLMINEQSKPEIIKEMISEIEPGEEGSKKYLDFTIHWGVKDWPSGFNYKNFYVGVYIPNEEQDETAPCYFHWDIVNLTFWNNND